MLRAVLFDMDDTLLRNDMADFLPAYFAGLAEASARVSGGDRFVEHVTAAIRETVAGADGTEVLLEGFLRALQEKTQLALPELNAIFDGFYAGPYAALRRHTAPVAGAAALVQRCSQHGLPVVLATNPLFSQVAIEQRLAWAELGVGPEGFRLVTHVGNMHYAKPSPRYYQEILQRIGVAAEDALMVGNDWQNDIEPALTVGLRAFWVSEEVRMGVASGPVSRAADLIFSGALG